MDVKPLENLPALLLPWFETNARKLPWREDTVPYHVWLSEVMLQQTRVEAVKAYYLRFLAQLPDIASLAAADPERLNKLWEGLGYYSRVRNLQNAAKRIVQEHDGRFPGEYEAIRALPGIGDYTAGAIASISFGLPTPAVDGNVLRVVSRLTASPACVSDEKVKQTIRSALGEIYPQGQCGAFTQSLMELGATVCLPAGAPKCDSCPAAGVCLAHRQGIEQTLPVKAEKKPRRQQQRTVLILCCEGHYALEKRPASGLLAGLWQLPDTEGALNEAEAIRLAERWETKPCELLRCARKTHIFTHIQWDMTGYYIDCTAMPTRFTWADAAALAQTYSLPTAYRQFFDGGNGT